RKKWYQVMLSRCMSHTLSIVGAGRVGRALGKRLGALGWRVGAVVTRSASTARDAVRAMDAGEPYGKLTNQVFKADTILMAAPDGQLAVIARALAKIGGADCRGKIVLHTSGALDRTVLASLARLGASTGSLHPMQTFSGRGTPRLKGAIFAIEGDPRAQSAARKIARALGGIPVEIDGERKPAYHAAGVLVAGHALGLVEGAAQILMSCGFTRRRAIEALLPLMRQMLDNYEQHGPRAAWTGPIPRGDFGTVARHRRALRPESPELQSAYAALALLSAKVLLPNPESAMRRLKKALLISRGGSQ
ncbi:MAG: Rossmann-like and DUF2520 domain-containing protein, partial [Candidatus Dormibacteria bacterium]